ncbi:acetyl-CoA synthetase [Christensenella minuta]|uniref:AMP-binding enzyme n=1 Tax=Christensenella minuta TaxID=626937 RepID=A0A136Q093_9FIRM|nr:AMP-binding protein [Christensenella minuta]AYH41474.1 acetyl-CoA synthetase [Christensenella minuta]KXK64077.1 AMP-binding enzyme [Christensenella minuta]OAQ36969.1 acetyl-CoA synthetase [Christensenella minuta]
MLEKFLDRTEFTGYDDFKQNYKLNIPDHFNFSYDIVDEWAKQDENKPALVWCDDDGNEKRFSFGDIKRMSDKAANMLKSMGVRRGEPVMLMLKQRPEVWFMMVGLHKLGAICIPATFQLTPKDIIYRCNAADVKMICAVDDDEMLRHIEASLPECKTVENVGVVGENVPAWGFDLRAALGEASENWTREYFNETGDPMLIYFSSGTTGMPKMILHDFTYPLGHIVTAKYWQKVEDGGLHLTVSDSGWAKFGWGKIYGQWICGAVIVAYDTEKFNPQKLLETIDRLKLTTFCAPPTIYRFLIKEDMSHCDFSTIKHAGIAGEPLNPEVYNRFLETTGLAVTEGFGQSETSVLIANFGWDPIKPGSTGKPSPLYDVDIVDEDGNSCEDGVVGSIVVKNTDKKHPAGLFKKYYRDEEATNRCWKNGVYNTGDTAWRDAEGYFWFVGRNDDVIKCSGYRIGPFEVESALLTHPCVLECAVTAVPDPVRGQVVKATVVLARGFEASDTLKKELQTHVKNVTAPYKYPRVVEFVDELPKTVSGKIRRVQIRNEDADK